MLARYWRVVDLEIQSVSPDTLLTTKMEPQIMEVRMKNSPQDEQFMQ